MANLPPEYVANVALDTIVRVVSLHFGLELADLGSRQRAPIMVFARSCVAVLAKRYTRCSYPQIAAACGRPAHSTMIAAHRRLEALLEADARLVPGVPVREAFAAVEQAVLKELPERFRRTA